MSQAVVNVQAEPVKRLVQSVLQKKDTEMLQSMEHIRKQFLTLSQDLEMMDETGKLAAMRAEYRKVLELELEVRAHQAALTELQDSYAANGIAPTAFHEVLQQMAAEISAEPGFDNQSAADLAQFDQETGAQPPPGSAGEGLEDDDCVMDASGLLNVVCPITMKPVLELKEPVEDPAGYVYEKEAVMAMIRRSRLPTLPCPVAGTSHTISAAGLKPSRRIVRERRKAMLIAARGGTQPGPSRGASARQDVFDADELS
ncbi:hypothetical protein QJQ45_003731 [Haematococcus lacustris]|nr:hypothetical protein QJQ45_003731 [Haematococcus lacustris]